MGSVAESWTVKASRGKSILESSIPKQWLLPKSRIPPTDQTNVINVPRESGLLSERELRITESTATELVASMAIGMISAEEVTIAFLKRATIGHQLTNFATEFLADEAIVRAKELDIVFRYTGKIVGPLHGVPISVKEHCGLEGKTCNAGFVAWVDQIAQEDCHMVELLKKAGCVVHVRTNEPQSLMHLDCGNNITGATCNPHNRTLSPGGSSGGEGASLGFRASALGVGTDIGGSIRAPAAFCGVYGLRPSACRLPLGGLYAAGTGQESVKPVIGPLANSLEDIELYMKASLDQKPWEKDVTVMPVPWRAQETPKTVRVAIMTDDGIVRPHPPIMRALRVAREKLTAAGIEVVDWQNCGHEDAFEIVKKMYFADGALSLKAILAESGEPIMPLTQYVLDNVAETQSVAQNWELNYRRDKLRAKHNKLLRGADIDAILCPTYQGVAAVNGDPSYWLYTALWNILDLPALVFPTGLSVDQDLDKVDESYVPRSEQDKKEYEKYSPEKYKDAPICLQLVGKNFCDEELIAAARVIERIIID